MGWSQNKSLHLVEDKPYRGLPSWQQLKRPVASQADPKELTSFPSLRLIGMVSPYSIFTPKKTLWGSCESDLERDYFGQGTWMQKMEMGWHQEMSCSDTDEEEKGCRAQVNIRETPSLISSQLFLAPCCLGFHVDPAAMNGTQVAHLISI